MKFYLTLANFQNLPSKKFNIPFIRSRGNSRKPEFSSYISYRTRERFAAHGGFRFKTVLREKLAKPIVDDTVENEMHALSFAVIDDAVRQIEI